MRVPIPLTLMLTPSEPGVDELCLTITPAFIPDNAAAGVVIGRDLAICSKSVVATEPVRFTFFCTP